MPEAYYSWIRKCQVPDSEYYREMWESLIKNDPAYYVGAEGAD